MNILIIGGTGKIGKKILTNIDKEKFNVFSINKKGSCNIKNINYFKFNYYKNLKKIIHLNLKYKFDVVVNLIAFNEKDVRRDYKIFKKTVKRYLYISSTSVYKNSKKPIYENSKIETNKIPYISGKIDAENFLRHKTTNFPFTILRICHVYGFNNLPTLFKKKSLSVLNDIKKNNRILLPKKNNLWKVIYDDDLGKIIIKIISSNNKNLLRKKFNIVPDEGTTWKKIYQNYLTKSNLNLKVKYLNLKKIKLINRNVYNHLVYDKLKNANFKNKRIFKIIRKPKFKNFDKQIKVILKKNKNLLKFNKIDKDFLEIILNSS